MPLTFPESPSVTIQLTGHMLLRFDQDGHYCDVFLKKSDAEHVLKTSIKIGANTEQIFAAANGNPRKLFIAAVNGRHKAIEIFKSSEPLNRRHPMTPGARLDSDESRDFRWVLDLTAPEFSTGRTVLLSPDDVQHAVRIEGGLFYTSRLIDPRFDDVVVKRNGVPDVHLHSIADVIGINLYLDHRDSTFTMRWDDEVAPFLALPRLRDPIPSQITIENLPPDPQGATDHFSHYREMLSEISNDDWPSLSFPTGSALDVPSHGDHPHPRLRIETSPDVPCMPGTTGGG